MNLDKSGPLGGQDLSRSLRNIILKKRDNQIAAWESTGSKTLKEQNIEKGKILGKFCNTDPGFWSLESITIRFSVKKYVTTTILKS